MADEIKAPGLPTGLALTAKLYAAGALVQSVGLTESPASSTNYANTSTLTLASGSYAVVVVDGSGNVYGGGELNWNSTNASAGVNVARVDGVDARLGSLGGGGTYAMIVNVQDQNGNPVPDVNVRATGSAIAWGITDNSGNVTLSLDTGAYTLTATATGYIGYTSTVQTVQAPGKWVSTTTTTLIITITNVMPPAPPAGQITGYLYTQIPGTTIYYEMTVVPPGSGMQLIGTTQSYTSDSSGLWSVPLYLGATYTFNCGGGPTNTILIPSSGSTLELQNLLSL